MNHLLKATNVNEEQEKADMMRLNIDMHSLEKQNELFPNNLEFRMKQKLTTQRVAQVQEEKTLEE